MQKFLDSNSLESLDLDEPESEYVSYMQKFLDSNSLESLGLDEPESEYVSYMQKFLDSNSLESLGLDEPESEYGLIHEVLGTQRSKPQFQSRSSLLNLSLYLLKSWHLTFFMNEMSFFSNTRLQEVENGFALRLRSSHLVSAYIRLQ
jgi:hypothetical protein